MKLIKLKLRNFRNHEKLELAFGAKTVLLGENGSGKSNIFEAIYLVSTGKSYRADKEEEMIRYGQNVASIACEISNASGEEQVDVVLTDGTLKTTKKKFEVNKVPRRMIDAVGHLKSVLFAPGDLDLITGSPSIRRKYLDFVIGQKDREYRRNSLSYEKGLRQRNKLLQKIRDEGGSRSQLFFWDRLLIKNGEYITEKRAELMNFFNNTGTRYDCVYDKSVISESRLKQYEVEEVLAGSTLVGPHRDDFWVNMQGRDISKYASRGEQRMGVMWLKRNELKYLSGDNDAPLMLLDDIFSELDHIHRKEIENEIDKLIFNGGQVILSTADPHMTPAGKNWEKINIED